MNLHPLSTKGEAELKKHAVEGVWGVCAYCGKALASPNFHGDVGRCYSAVRPERAGGSSFVGNLVPACRSCMASKRDFSLSEFRRILQLNELRDHLNSQSGANFTSRQAAWLAAQDFCPDRLRKSPGYLFYFEDRYELAQYEGTMLFPDHVLNASRFIQSTREYRQIEPVSDVLPEDIASSIVGHDLRTARVSGRGPEFWEMPWTASRRYCYFVNHLASWLVAEGHWRTPV